MKPINRRTLHSRGLLSAQLSSLLSALLVVTLLSSTAFAWQGGAATATKQAATATKQAAPASNPASTTTPASTLTQAERKATRRIKLKSIREITTKLGSKEFEGRGTGQPGADKAAAYLADLFKKFGLKPAADNGAYLQQIKFRSAEILPETSVKVGEVQLKQREDYVVLPPYISETVDVSGGLVFVITTFRDNPTRRHNHQELVSPRRFSEMLHDLSFWQIHLFQQGLESSVGTQVVKSRIN